MFPTTDRTRRRLGLLLFVVLCLAPTMAVLGGGLWLTRPAHVEDCQRQLAGALGLGVKIESVTYPLPGVTLLSGLSICDPETRDVLLETRLLEIHKQQNVWHLKAEQPQLQASAAPRLRDWLDRLLREPGNDRPRFVLVAGDVTVHQGEQSQTFTEVSGWYEPLPAGARAGLHFRLAGETVGEMGTLELVRNRQTTPPATRIELRAPSPLPCEYLGAGLPWNELAGGAATFEGQLYWTLADESWEADVRGRLDGIDLYRLISGRFPHQLGGPATLAIGRARIRDGRLEEAQGTLTAGPGVVSGSLLTGLAESLAMPLLHAPRTPDGAITWPSPEQVFEYQKLALKFQMADGKLALAAANPESPGVVIDGARGPLLGEPTTLQPVTGLVRALVPTTGVEVPLTRETDLLLGVLPVGKTVVESPVAPPGRSRLRVSD